MTQDEPESLAPTPESPPASCPTCGNAMPAGERREESSGYVYAVGRVEPRFPSLGAEKEFSQAVGRAQTAGLTDRETLNAVLGQRENRYLARQLCWVLAIQGLDTYILQPREGGDLDLLIEAVRPRPGPGDQDVVIGVRAGVAPAAMCNGLTVPIVVFDQIYSFDRAALVESIPRPEDIAAKDFQAAAAEVFDRITQMAGNAGASDEQRALNYLVVRYPALYAAAADAFARDRSLSAVDVRRSALSGPRTVVEVVFSFTDRNTDVTEKQFVRVDVSEQFPFLVTKMAPYVDR